MFLEDPLQASDMSYAARKYCELYQLRTFLLLSIVHLLDLFFVLTFFERSAGVPTWIGGTASDKCNLGIMTEVITSFS